MPHLWTNKFSAEEEAVDVVVRGEGEQTLLELTQNVSNLKAFNRIDGITFRKNGQVFRTPNRPFMQNLDELPLPAYKYFPLEKYRLFGRKMLPIITSRGCPSQCSFCTISSNVWEKLQGTKPQKCC